MLSPETRLLGFFVLLAVMFVLAYAAGTRVGPVAPTHEQMGNRGSMHMSMGAGRERRLSAVRAQDGSR